MNRPFHCGIFRSGPALLISLSHFLYNYCMPQIMLVMLLCLLILSFTITQCLDPDLEIRGRTGQQKKFFRPLGPQFGLKIRGELGPFPWRRVA